MLIAIDGPAGAGKSTVARALAAVLGFRYLDTGAMYRSVGLLAAASPDSDAGALARAARIEWQDGGRGQEQRVLLDGCDVTEEIRTPGAAEAASRVAADPAVRAALVAKQRALIGQGDWVVEGRDIGTVVAPHAELKVFLTAGRDERARRRAAQGAGATEQVLAQQGARDRRDESRAHSPLREAPDAVRIDTSRMSADEVVQRIAALAGERAV